jgi:hypothetical protein
VSHGLSHVRLLLLLLLLLRLLLLLLWLLLLLLLLLHAWMLLEARMLDLTWWSCLRVGRGLAHRCGGGYGSGRGSWLLCRGGHPRSARRLRWMGIMLWMDRSWPIHRETLVSHVRRWGWVMR